MSELLLQIPSWIVTGLIGLLGIAVGWGWFKSEVSHLKESQKSQDTKIENLQKEKLNIAFKTDCGEFRNNCKEEVNKKFDDIKLAIDKNRDTVLEKFEEVQKFMGYVGRVVEEINGKPKL